MINMAKYIHTVIHSTDKHEYAYTHIRAYIHTYIQTDIHYFALHYMHTYIHT